MFRPPSTFTARLFLRQQALPVCQRRFASVFNETASFNARAQRKATSWTSPYKILLGFMPIFTFGLGTWQTYRLQWKLALIDELTAQLQKEPMELPRKVNIDALPEFEWRRVTVRGIWDHAHSILIGPRIRENKAGYNVITPLQRPEGSTILVDRGFVEKEHADAARDGPRDLVEVTGMLRLEPKKNSFTPDNCPEQGEWFWPDVQQLVAHAGGDAKGVQPVLVEALYRGTVASRLSDLSLGVPVGRDTVVDLRNQHATYAAIWYSLSAATSVMFWLLLRGQKAKARPRRFP